MEFAAVTRRCSRMDIPCVNVARGGGRKRRFSAFADSLALGPLEQDLSGRGTPTLGTQKPMSVHPPGFVRNGSLLRDDRRYQVGPSVAPGRFRYPPAICNSES